MHGHDDHITQVGHLINLGSEEPQDLGEALLKSVRDIKTARHRLHHENSCARSCPRS